MGNLTKGTLWEKMKSMPRIKVQFEDQFVVEIKKGEMKIAEIVCHVDELTFNPGNNESQVKLTVYNPSFKGKQTITEYY